MKNNLYYILLGIEVVIFTIELGVIIATLMI
jgi:hypothetical protein